MSSSQLTPFVAGSLAGVVTKTATAPLERIKTLLQVEGMRLKNKERAVSASASSSTSSSVPTSLLQKKPPTIPQVFTRILAQDGVRGFWYGNGANCLRVVPVYALKFGFNDTIKDAVRKTPGERLSVAQLVASGSLAGLFQTSVTYPLEVVRTRLTVGVAHGAEYSGIWDCFKSTVKHEGIRGLYKGLSPTMLTGSPYVGMQMASFTVLMRMASDSKFFGTQETIQSACCGALAGMMAQTITYPGDTIRKRMQTDGIRGTKQIYNGMFDCMRTVFRNEGFRTLYAGLGANLIRGIPGAAVQFTAFNCFKNLLTDLQEGQTD